MTSLRELSFLFTLDYFENYLCIFYYLYLFDDSFFILIIFTIP